MKQPSNMRCYYYSKSISKMGPDLFLVFFYAARISFCRAWKDIMIFTVSFKNNSAQLAANLEIW